MVSRKDAVKARIKQAREACGLTMRQMAKAIGVAHDVTIARYESGVREPDWDTLERIAQATKRDIAWFFQDDDAAEPAPAPAENPTPQPDMQSLLAQLVAAQTQMLQAQARADARLERLEDLMAEAVQHLRAEGQEGCCGYGEGHAEGPGQASGDARRSA